MSESRKAFQEQVIKFRGYSDLMDGSGLYIQPGLEKTWKSFRLGFDLGRSSQKFMESKQAALEQVR